MIFEQVSQNFWSLLHALVRRIRNDSLLRNSIYIMSTTVTTSAIGYLYWIVAAHIYSTQDVGLASAIIAVMMLTATFSNLGIDSTLVHILPRRETGYAWSLTLNAGLVIGTLAGLLAGSIVVLVLPFFSRQFAIFAYYPTCAFVFIAGVPLWIITTLLDQTFVAERAANNTLVRNAAFAVIKFVLMVLLTSWGVLGIFSGFVLAAAATLIGAWLVLIPYLKRAYCLAVRGIVGQVRTMLSLLAWNHFINIGGLMPVYLVPVFVTVRLSAADNAYYYTTSMVGGFFYMISSAVAVALFAEGSHATDNVLHKTRSSAVIITILLIPAMLIAFLGGRSIMLLFGPNYAQYGLPLLTILTITAVPDAITNIYVSVLRVQRRLRRAVLLNLGMASLTLLLSWLLLPILGIAGAGWAFFAAQTAGSLVAAADLISFSRRG
ncbi:MAG: hypothetical protein JO202_03300 [Ktedonobacteraceae bacterium]|nr:hypothetical protein [Ktedonobacteraceae bacterium]